MTGLQRLLEEEERKVAKWKAGSIDDTLKVFPFRLKVKSKVTSADALIACVHCINSARQQQSARQI